MGAKITKLAEVKSRVMLSGTQDEGLDGEMLVMGYNIPATLNSSVLEAKWRDM